MKQPINSNGLMPVKRVVISLAKDKQSDLSILINGLLAVCPGVKIYADNETHEAIKNIFEQKPGRIKGGELHRLEFEVIENIDLAIIGPKVFEEDSGSSLSNLEELDHRRFNLILTMAANLNRTLTLVNPDAEVYNDLIHKLQGSNGMIGATARLLRSYDSINVLHDNVCKMSRSLGMACDNVMSITPKSKGVIHD
jgi:hypothetical protein